MSGMTRNGDGDGHGDVEQPSLRKHLEKACNSCQTVLVCSEHDHP